MITWWNPLRFYIELFFLNCITPHFQPHINTSNLCVFSSDWLSQSKCTINTWHDIMIWLLAFLWGQNKLPEIVSQCFLCLRGVTGDPPHVCTQWVQLTHICGQAVQEKCHKTDFWPFVILLSWKIRGLLVSCLVICEATSNNWMFLEAFQKQNTLDMHFKSFIWL